MPCTSAVKPEVYRSREEAVQERDRLRLEYDNPHIDICAVVEEVGREPGGPQYMTYEEALEEIRSWGDLRKAGMFTEEQVQAIEAAMRALEDCIALGIVGEP